jgi:hypothetical protein
MIKGEPVITPQLDMMAYHKGIYSGEEDVKIVGIRKTEVELYYDASGGTNPSYTKSWFSIKGLFRKRKLYEQHEKFGTCTLHNLHCGYPECEPYV